MSTPQVDYTSRDFTALRADLIQLIKTRTGLDEWDPTDPSDLGSVLVEAFAYMGDIMSYYIDRAANETTLTTAIKRQTLLDFANLYGYKPSGPTPALVTITFTNDGINSIDLPKGTQVMAPLSYAPFTEVFFETTTAVTNLLPDQSIDVLCQEGKTVNTDRPDLIDVTYNIALPANLGSSTGEANQEFLIIDSGIVDNSLTVYVGQGPSFAPWTQVTSLTEYGPNSLVYTVKQNETGSASIVFGDGVNGAIPGPSQVISAVYKTSAGSVGNIKSGSVREVTFIPGNPDQEALTSLTVVNTAAAIGGADQDDQSKLRDKIKSAIVTQRRAVTLADYENLISQVPQIGKVKSIADVYTSVTAYVQSQNDNSATPGITQTISGISNVVGNGTAVTVTVANDYSPGDVVVIAGVNPTAYNGAVTVSTATSTNFTFASSTVTAYVSGGTVTKGEVTENWNELSTAVSRYISDKKMIGTTVTVSPPVYIPIYIEVQAYAGSAYKASDIKLAIYKAFLGTEGLFSYAKNTFGRSIPFSTVVLTAADIDGITSVTIVKLNTTGAVSAGDITLDPSQIPYLTSANLDITVLGGIQ